MSPRALGLSSATRRAAYSRRGGRLRPGMRASFAARPAGAGGRSFAHRPAAGKAGSTRRPPVPLVTVSPNRRTPPPFRGPARAATIARGPPAPAPDRAPRPAPKGHRMASGTGKLVGIDLGTTFSAIATLDDNGRPVTLPNRDG